MLKASLIGAAVFGVLSAVAGYVWTTFEFPFVLLVPAAVGWYAVSLVAGFGQRKSLWAALVGGVAFTAAFLVAVFFALTDGSPIALTAWMSATLAAAVAGAATGLVLDGRHGAVEEAAFAAVGMLAATVIVGLMRSVAPASIDVAGPAQSAYFASAIGLVGVTVGAAVGAGTAYVSARRASRGETAGPPELRVHGA